MKTHPTSFVDIHQPTNHNKQTTSQPHAVKSSLEQILAFIHMMHIAIEGCTHGALDETYAAIAECEAQNGGQKIDLLLCCGDFQSTRNLRDLQCMAVPDKYKDMCSFYKYYSGEKIAPILTLFIGGNHEASNVLQELPYGGWVAPNIYYLGYAGVVKVGGVRIGGLSGIYNGHNYLKGHFERPPYDRGTQRSAYHVRNLEAFRLKQLAQDPPQILMSHDWPEDADKFGNLEQLLRFKPHFREDVQAHKLGSRPAREILDIVQPEYWFSGHLHCKYAALIEHEGGRSTKFLALDKCLPRRRFLQILTVGSEIENGELQLEYDPAWLAILKSTNHLLSVASGTQHMPGPGYSDRHDFQPTREEIQEVERIFDGDFQVPKNFQKSAPAFNPERESLRDLRHTAQSEFELNPQTVDFTEKLQIANPVAMLMSQSEIREQTGTSGAVGLNCMTFNEDEIPLGDDYDDEEEDQTENQEMKEPARKSMVLPAPKFEAASSNSVDDVKSSDNGECSFIIDTKGEEDGAKLDEPVPNKKLKRRNQSIYSHQDE